jgi:periplasmic divalent cation tolerance protein
MTDISYAVVLVTTPSQTEAQAIASALIEAKLAACVSFFPVHSVYTWQGQVNSDEEWQLLIKSDLSLFSDLSQKIQELHSYEVPEIIALPILAGSKLYLSWLGKNLR